MCQNLNSKVLLRRTRNIKFSEKLNSKDPLSKVGLVVVTSCFLVLPIKLILIFCCFWKLEPFMTFDNKAIFSTFQTKEHNYHNMSKTHSDLGQMWSRSCFISSQKFLQIFPQKTIFSKSLRSFLVKSQEFFVLYLQAFLF